MHCASCARSGGESRGGGNAGNHGRRKLPIGHLRSLMGRARPLQGEVRSLHGLASRLLAAVPAPAPTKDGRKQEGSEFAKDGIGSDGDGMDGVLEA
jgi:hypothetical protein